MIRRKASVAPPAPVALPGDIRVLLEVSHQCAASAANPS